MNLGSVASIGNEILERDISLVNKLHNTEKKLNTIILGKERIVRLSLACFLSGGHLLLDDLPGSGKTTLAKALAKAFAVDFKRIQFTSDLLPSDILGVSIYNPTDLSFKFHRGPIFTNVLLADEINRCSPRTQSSLLEAMDEKQVSIDGKTYPLGLPFFVIATQNPVDLSGTFPLPDSQLDRFLFKLTLGHPSRENEILLLKNRNIITSAGEDLISSGPEWTDSEIVILQKAVKGVHVSDNIANYVYNLVEKTRDSKVFKNGLSTRAAIAMMTAGKAVALLNGALVNKENYVKPEDIQYVFKAVASHRLTTTPDNPNDVNQSLDYILSSVKVL